MACLVLFLRAQALFVQSSFCGSWEYLSSARVRGDVSVSQELAEDLDIELRQPAVFGLRHLDSLLEARRYVSLSVPGEFGGEETVVQFAPTEDADSKSTAQGLLLLRGMAGRRYAPGEACFALVFFEMKDSERCLKIKDVL